MQSEPTERHAEYSGKLCRNNVGYFICDVEEVHFHTPQDFFLRSQTAPHHISSVVYDPVNAQAALIELVYSIHT